MCEHLVGTVPPVSCPLRWSRAKEGCGGPERAAGGPRRLKLEAHGDGAVMRRKGLQVTGPVLPLWVAREYPFSREKMMPLCPDPHPPSQVGFQSLPHRNSSHLGGSQVFPLWASGRGQPVTSVLGLASQAPGCSALSGRGRASQHTVPHRKRPGPVDRPSPQDIWCGTRLTSS